MAKVKACDRSWKDLDSRMLFVVLFFSNVYCESVMLKFKYSMLAENIKLYYVLLLAGSEHLVSYYVVLLPKPKF